MTAIDCAAYAVQFHISMYLLPFTNQIKDLMYMNCLYETTWISCILTVIFICFTVQLGISRSMTRQRPY